MLGRPDAVVLYPRAEPPGECLGERRNGHHAVVLLRPLRVMVELDRRDKALRDAERLRRPGAGLGLYFAALIAAMHKNSGREGTVAVANGGSLGGGCFRISLP